MPLVMKWVGHIEEGIIDDRLVSYTDFLASFSAMLGYELKETEGEDSYDGFSLFSTKYAKPYVRDHVIHQGMSGLLSFRKCDWKLINGSGKGFCDEYGYVFENVNEKYQLFNMKDDIQEIRDVCKDYPELVKVIKEELDTLVKQGFSR